MYSINPYAFNPDEFYASSGTFDQTSAYIMTLSVIQENPDEYPTNESILVIEVKEGVFIRAKTVEWCNLLTSVVNEPEARFPVLKIIPESKWNTITRAVRAPINSFGDERLAMWKVGF